MRIRSTPVHCIVAFNWIIYPVSGLGRYPMGSGEEMEYCVTYIIPMSIFEVRYWSFYEGMCTGED